MAGEITKIVASKFPSGGEDLVQEVLLAIALKNKSAASAFDPSRGKNFASYVYMVARSKAGHFAGSEARRRHPVIAVEDAALEAMATSDASGEASQVEATPSTVSELVDQLAQAKTQARRQAATARRSGNVAEARYQEGLRDALHGVCELLSEAFRADAAPPLARRIVALLAWAPRPMSSGQISAALLEPTAAVERALRSQRGGATRLREVGRGVWRLAHEGDPRAARRRPEAARNALTIRLTDDELAELERAASLRGTSPREWARTVVVHAHGEGPATLLLESARARVRQTLTSSLARWNEAAFARGSA